MYFSGTERALKDAEIKSGRNKVGTKEETWLRF